MFGISKLFDAVFGLAMPMPILGEILAGVSLGSKLLGGFMGGRKKKKQGEALERDARERQEARKAGHEVDERRRRERLNATQGLLQRVGGSLPQGAPDYTFDPEVLQKIQELRPFTETVGDQRVALTGQGGDPTAGAGSGMLQGFMSGLGDAAGTAAAGYDNLFQGSSPAGGASDLLQGSSPMGGSTGGVDPTIDWDEVLKGLA